QSGMALSVLRCLLLFHAVNISTDKNILKTLQLQKFVDIQRSALAKNILRKTLHKPRIALNSRAPQTNIRLNLSALVSCKLICFVTYNFLAKNYLRSIFFQKLSRITARLLRI